MLPKWRFVNKFTRFLPSGNVVALGTVSGFIQNGIPLSSFSATISPGLGGRKRQKSS